MKSLVFPKRREVSLGSDVIVLVCAVLFAWFFATTWIDMHRPASENPAVALAPANLLYYSMRTTMRFLIGMVWSTLFSLVFGVLAARYAPMRRVILPFVNFMESVPLVGFMTFTTGFFLGLYPHNTMGMEALAIFAVFTGQAWNMMLTVYQTMRVVPKELREVADSFRYNAWQRFWRLEWPYSVPGFLWNAINSQAAAWFALVASEAIPAANGDTVLLPGVGSYVSMALDSASYRAVVYALIALVLNIVVIDQFIFRPLVRYTIRFKSDDSAAKRDMQYRSWFYDCLASSRIARSAGELLAQLANAWIFGLPRVWYALRIDCLTRLLARANWLWSTIWYFALTVGCAYGGYQLWQYVPKQDLAIMPWWMLETAARVTLAMLLSCLLFVPLGVWMACHPRRLTWCQPVAQVLAAIPPNIYYPLIALFVITAHRSLGWWTIPMIMVGTQWYYLFNAIAGTLAIPTQITEVSQMFHLKGAMWWRKYMLPAIFPYIVTGTISAAGGAWNAAIAAEIVQWGSHTASTSGLGAFISTTTANGDHAAAALGCTAMCSMVALCIMFVWQPLYRFAERKFRYD
ncbi:ABC transporter permease subunit [Burkholderia glumae]|uniref:ABC transporter permease subunit n=1 Tax=Burkholderia glumae TaxID=337 RepID=UPI000F5FB51A|nr:ABC transporter permease subunit [Burkholderia glumae]MCR1768941.1 ABC transporter permease subunit [Burkholderia glumae]QHP89563.1 ABC transporter permease subunit [Burkholderia glumae]QJW77336.1 ABC transporter permease subunit [Burkholderia glumae]QKM46803.1 Bicarbonate transport system permease protein CmpB [Burkholderia glumae]RQZ75165.1 ABC transporter permease subunit [Burkholderia glumae]